jgi:CHAD domain-containing protein
MSPASQTSGLGVTAGSPPGERRGRSSVAELGAKYCRESAHADHVTALALTLFDATHELVGAPEDDRGLLEAACRLHDLGYGVNPRRHAQIGQEIVKREGLAGYSPAQRRDIAGAIGLHSLRDRGHPVQTPAGQPPESLRALRLAAYLRIADGLDYCHLQDATIVGFQPRNGVVHVLVRCCQFPQSVEIAVRRSALWRDVFSRDLRFVLAGGPPHRFADLLTRELGIFEALRRLLFREYRAMAMHLEGVLRCENDQALHDLRIAIRKARTLLRGFRKPLTPTSARRLDGDLQRLNRALGAARDLDVWIAFLTSGPVKLRLAGNRNWHKFTDHQRELRRLQQVTVRRHLSGSAFTTLQTRFGRLLRVELPREIERVPTVPIEAVARRALARQLRRAMHLAELRHAGSPKKLHRLRIALRRVRYLSLSFSPVLGPVIDRLRKRAHAVERVLGDIRDTSLALTRIQHEGPTPPRLLVSQLRRSQQDAMAKLERVWPRLDDPALMLRVRRTLEG